MFRLASTLEQAFPAKFKLSVYELTVLCNCNDSSKGRTKRLVGPLVVHIPLRCGYTCEQRQLFLNHMGDSVWLRSAHGVCSTDPMGSFIKNSPFERATKGYPRTVIFKTSASYGTNATVVSATPLQCDECMPHIGWDAAIVILIKTRSWFFSFGARRFHFTLSLIGAQYPWRSTRSFHST